jgi:hypothetical protein
MGDLSLYFKLGVAHIADLKGIDHILFIVALCLRYQYSDWKQLLVMLSAFTIGHSITLALSVFNVLHFSTSWIEFFIPLTIVITAINNLFVRKINNQHRFPLIYYFALFFGLIHGLGFSSYLKSLLGRNESIVSKLLSFNIGIEAGQMIILFAILSVSVVFLQWLKVNRREYILFVSGGIIAMATEMMVSRIP